MSEPPRIDRARSADGVTVAFAVTGHGPPLVFVPWVPFSNLQLEWANPLLRAVFERLAGRVTLVRYDGRGTGHSQRDVADLSLDAMVADLEAVLRAADLGEVSLLGQYNACPHAIAFAARHPRRVRSLVLFGGSARGWDAMSARQTQALLSLIEQDWDLFADTAAHQWMGWSAGEIGRAMAEGFRDAVTPSVARATLRAASAVDVTREARRVSAPALVLHRRGMSQLPVEVSRTLARTLPRGRLVVLEGSRPVLFLDEPTAVTDLLLDFVCAGVLPPETVPPQRNDAVPATPVRALTRRETDVLRLVAAGQSNAQIARRLGVSVHTVERHVANLYPKIGARGRADATAYAIRAGLF
jgi:pimeloyl-ACP methyl ester carboxylesterase/DNA-binding CsgD family transcriptional regulator